MRILSVSQVCYFSATDASPKKLGSGCSSSSLLGNVPQTQAILINVLEILRTSMNIFQDDVGEKQKHVEGHNIKGQKSGIGRMQNKLFRKDPVSAPSSTPIPSHEPA